MKTLIFAALVLISTTAQAQISVSPFSMNFRVDLKSPGARDQETFWVNNNGAAPLQLRVQSWSCPTEIRVIDYCHYVPAWGGCNGTVTFEPTRAGRYTCDVQIEDWSSSHALPTSIWITGVAEERRSK